MTRDAHRGRTWLAAVLTIIPLAFTCVALILIAVEIANGWSQIDEPGVTQTMIAAIALCLTFPLVGWTILRHDPSNRLGWVYLAIGFFESLNLIANAYVIIAFRTGTGDDASGRRSCPAIAIWAWVPGFTLFSTLGILLFPDGRLPTPALVARRCAGGRRPRPSARAGRRRPGHIVACPSSESSH